MVGLCSKLMFAAAATALAAGMATADQPKGATSPAKTVWSGPLADDPMFVEPVAPGQMVRVLPQGRFVLPGTFAGQSGTVLRGPGQDACCDANANCTLVTTGTCTGTVVAGGTCSPNPCPVAWCDADGICTAGTAGSPPATALYGNVGTCTPNPCASFACCAPDGTCSITTSYNACPWIGFGITGTCAPNPCVQPVCQGTPTANCQPLAAPTATGGVPTGQGAGNSSDADISGGTGFNSADNFVAGATGGITSVCWYGRWFNGGSFAYIPPDITTQSFRIRYYGASGAGNPGLPGALLAEFTVGGLTPTPGTTFVGADVAAPSTTYLYNNNLAFGFQATHPAVNVTAGTCYWIEIVHTGVNVAGGGNTAYANRWRWIQAGTATDSYRLQKAGQVDPVTNPFGYADVISGLGDQAFCVGITLGNVSTGCSRLAPPANANCNTATLITPGFTATNAQNISGGTTATGFCGVNYVTSPTVWYRVVGNGTTMTASTCGANTNFDTILNVYCGSCAAGNNGGLNCVADNDTGPATCTGGTGSDPSQVSWPTVNGTTYYIMVGGFQADTGFFDFSLTSDGVQTTAPACGNDRCPLDNSGISTAEVDACGVDTETDCGAGSNVCVLGVPVKGTMYNGNATRDIDVWNLQPPLPPNTWVTVSIQNEFPMLHQGVEGYYCPGGVGFSVMTLDDGTGYGAAVSYKPCAPHIFTALTASGNVNIVITATDFWGLPCSDGNNDYRFTITLAPTGACCVPNTAGCFITVQSDCTRAAIGGTYFGDNSTCSPEPCFGACCATNGTCSFVSPTACASANGQFQGGNTTCSSGPCDVLTYACCTGGTCSLTTVSGCTGGGGTVSGFSCSPSPCAPQTGACCCGSGCSITTAAACSGTNQRFAGTGTVCNAVNNFTTPCCKGDYNKSAAGNVVSVQDIFDFLAGYFSGSLCADTNSSGAISVQDIFDFLSAYFGGC